MRDPENQIIMVQGTKRANGLKSEMESSGLTFGGSTKTKFKIRSMRSPTAIPRLRRKKPKIRNRFFRISRSKFWRFFTNDVSKDMSATPLMVFEKLQGGDTGCVFNQKMRFHWVRVVDSSLALIGTRPFRVSSL